MDLSNYRTEHTAKGSSEKVQAYINFKSNSIPQGPDMERVTPQHWDIHVSDRLVVKIESLLEMKWK